MKNLIKILSPGPGCWKTRKMIGSLKQFFEDKGIDAEFIIISDSEEHVKYDTWILPTILINGNIVARGYRPPNERILKHLM